MSDQEKIVLTDKEIEPTPNQVFSIIGNKKPLWENTMNYCYENYQHISEVWRFYNDGKCWLFRLLQKKNTVFWVGILADTFRISFWFGDKAESFIDKSDLPETIKQEFKTAKRYNKIRGISVKVLDTSDVETVKKLVDIKLSLK
jgi:hypothetical protein